MRRQLRIVLCKESPYDLINILGPFSVIKVELTDSSSVGKTARKIT